MAIRINSIERNAKFNKTRVDNLLKLSLDNVTQSYEFEFTEVHKVWTRHTMRTCKVSWSTDIIKRAGFDADT
jgi:hypothetical protein